MKYDSFSKKKLRKMKRYANLERFFEGESESYNENTAVMFNPFSVRSFSFLLLDQD